MDIQNRSFAGDYFVVTTPNRTIGVWVWEIHRRSKPLGVRLYHNGFPSESAAKLAGEKALRSLLDAIAEEEKKQYD